MEFDYKKFKSDYNTSGYEFDFLSKELLLECANSIENNRSFCFDFLDVLEKKFEIFINEVILSKLKEMAHKEHKIRVLDTAIILMKVEISDKIYDSFTNDNHQKLDYLNYTLRNNFLGWENEVINRKNIVDVIKIRAKEFISALEKIKEIVLNEPTNENKSQIDNHSDKTQTKEETDSQYRVLLLHKLGLLKPLNDNYKTKNPNSENRDFAKLVAEITNSHNVKTDTVKRYITQALKGEDILSNSLNDKLQKTLSEHNF